MSTPPIEHGSKHWATQRERGNALLMRLTAWATRTLGRRTVAPVVWLVVLYFYVFGAQARRSIAQYQRQLSSAAPNHDTLFPTYCPIYRQFLAFASALLDKLDVWQGKVHTRDLDVTDPHGLQAQMSDGRGQILVSAHLGNIEVCRTLAEQNPKMVMNVLVHDKHAERFNSLRQTGDANNFRLFQVSELNAATMMHLSERIERGEWIAIAGDRVPLHSERSVEVNFLDATAPFPQGPWLLAGILGCPVNLILCTKHERRFKVSMERLADEVKWTRSTRSIQIQHHAQAYADRLAAHCRNTPLQWFNFYPFWSPHA